LLAPGRVGVDVERYRSQVHRLSDRYLDASEQYILGQDTAGLTLGWVVKEAVFKWIGGGGIAFRDAIRIESMHSDPGKVQVSVRVAGQPDAAVLCVRYDEQPVLERVCAWVVEGQ